MKSNAIDNVRGGEYLLVFIAWHPRASTYHITRAGYRPADMSDRFLLISRTGIAFTCTVVILNSRSRR
jgi:hypothetical protein